MHVDIPDPLIPIRPPPMKPWNFNPNPNFLWAIVVILGLWMATGYKGC